MTILNTTIQENSSVDYDEISSFAGRVVLVFYGLIFIFGLLGNSMVIYVAIRKKNYRNVTNCYVINLAIADLLFLTLSIPYTTYLDINNRYPFGDIACKIYTYLAYGFLQATCNILAVMSIDRYLYIVRPKSKLRWRTSHNAFIICIFIWVCSLTLILPYHVISRVLIPGYTACGMNEHENIIVCLFPFCSYYAIPLVVIIVCYTNLAMHVVRAGRTMADHMSTENFHQTVQLKQRRVTRMVIVVTLAFAVCWLPIHILELLKCAQKPFLHKLIQSYPKVLYTLRAFTHALAYFNSCLNPYLYALLNRNFCMDLVDIIPSWRPCCKQTDVLAHDADSLNTKFSTNQIFHRKKSHHYDEEESEYPEPKEVTSDVGCQVELLGIESSKHAQYISSVHDQTKLI